jgi:hypothetical protein
MERLDYSILSKFLAPMRAKLALAFGQTAAKLRALFEGAVKSVEFQLLWRGPK